MNARNTKHEGYRTTVALAAAFCSTSSSLKAHHSPGWGVHTETAVIDVSEAVQRRGEGQGAEEDAGTKRN